MNIPASDTTEQALRDSEERFRATFEQAALGIAHIGLDMRMLRVNRKLCEMHGYTREELLGMRAGDLSPDAGASSRPMIQALLDGKMDSYTAQRRFTRRNGESYPAQVSVTLVKAREPYLVSIVEDLSREVADTRRIRRRADGRKAPDPDVDLSALARAWWLRFSDQAQSRAVTMSIAPTPRVQGDLRLLADALENLLGNAWKFTGHNERAHISFGAESGPLGRPIYFVRDDGAGFDPDYAHKLFTPFQRLHGAHEFDGTGIGLAVVRKIIQRHGGDIWAEGRPGEGATFRFTLP